MIGERIGHYEITGEIGAGGMGEVYRARDTKLGRDVALKMVPDLFAADPERMARFQREAQLLAARLREWGVAALDRFNGMFALALWDCEEERLLLARDRMGIKPLYLHLSDDGLLWASEIRALLASDRVERRLDRASVIDFLRYQTVHGPDTLIEGVEMLPAGHLIWADDNEVRIPGERRAERRKHHELNGVDVPKTLLEQIAELSSV